MLDLRFLDENGLLVESRLKKVTFLPQENGCLHNTQWLDSHGYPKISIGGRKVRKDYKLSRVMLYLKDSSAFFDGAKALHTCDNPLCVNPDHLYWGTSQENTDDCIRRGRKTNPPILTRDLTSKCKIKTRDYPNIIKLAKILNVTRIASYYGVSSKTIHKILKDLGISAQTDQASPKTPQITKLTNNILAEIILDSKTLGVTALAKKYKVARTTIYTWKSKYQF